MQDVQNIPNPDTSPNNDNEDFGSHSDVNPETRESDVETPGNEGDQGENVRQTDEDHISQEDARTGDQSSDLM